jgi:hypothetical protein
VTGTTAASLGRDLAVGALAGATGTAAMDLLLYRRYRRGGGSDSFWAWESAESVDGWEQASAPGQVGQKLEKVLARRSPPDSWARPTTNVVHWATGIGWAVQFGVLAGKPRRRPWLFGVALGPTVWLTSYVVLPLAKVYKPIWEYDVAVLAKDSPPTWCTAPSPRWHSPPFAGP